MEYDVDGEGSDGEANAATQAEVKEQADALRKAKKLAAKTSKMNSGLYTISVSWYSMINATLHSPNYFRAQGCQKKGHRRCRQATRRPLIAS